MKFPMGSTYLWTWCGHIGCAVIGVAGFLKLVDLNDFRLSLHQWDLLPSVLVPAATLLVPVAEVLIGACWFARIARPWVAIAACVMLAAFSVVLGIQMVLGRPVDCNCFGKLIAFESAIRSSVIGIAKNGVLAILIWAGYRSVVNEEKLRRQNHVAHMSKMRVSRPAFTLLEVVVVTVVVAVILAIGLAGLGRVRWFGRESVTLASLRTHAQVMSTYTNDYRGMFPLFVGDRPEQWTVTDGERTFPLGRYFLQSDFWAIALAPIYYGSTTPDASLFQTPHDPAATGGHWFPDYTYPCSFVAKPDYWDPALREYSRVQWGGTYIHQVTYPSNKSVMVLENWRVSDSGGRSMTKSATSAVDGHAGRYAPGMQGSTYIQGDGYPLEGYYHMYGEWGVDTLFGVRGRDF